MARPATQALAALGVGLGLVACRGDDGPPAPAPATTPGDPAVCEVATWEVAAEPVLRTWCTPCHASDLEGAARSGAPPGMDFDSWERAAPFASLIREAAVPDDARMPPEGIASAEERLWLGRWVDCGAPGATAPVGPCATLSTAPAEAADPCAAGHNHVAGDLRVEQRTDLACLCAVDGTLSAVGRPALDLPLLQYVGGDLDVAGSALTRLAAPALSHVGGDLVLEGQVGLAELDLPSLRTVGGDVGLIGSLAGGRLELQQLTDIGGDIVVEGLPTVEEVWLPRVETVGGSYRVEGNARLHSLPFFDELESIEGDLVVRDNPALTGVVLGPHLTTLGGSLEVGGNRLTHLALAYELPSVGGEVLVHDEPSLLVLEGLSATEAVAGSVRLEGLPALATLELLANARTIGGDLTLGTLPSVDSTGLAALQRVDGTVHVAGTGLLQAELPALEACGGLRMEGNPLLLGLSTPALAHVTGDLALVAMPAFQRLVLPDALGVDGSLVLDDLDALEELDPLHGIDRIGGDLVIQGNGTLTADEIQALLDAVVVEGAVIITDNG